MKDQELTEIHHLEIADTIECLKILQEKLVIKLDLAAGQSPREGFEGVDYVETPQTKHHVNLLQFPWPWDSNSIDELHCSHFIEHIPMAYTIKEDGVTTSILPTSTGKDLLFA